MKIIFRRTLILMFILVMTMSTNVSALAQTTGQVPISTATEVTTDNNEKETFEVLIKEDDGGITTNGTFYGDGGTSYLDYMSSNRSFDWGIRVTSNLALVFVGQIDIYTMNNVYRGTLLIQGEGIGAASGIVGIGEGGFNLTRGTNYIAKYSGIATTMDYHQYKVIDGAQIHFLYN